MPDTTFGRYVRRGTRWTRGTRADKMQLQEVRTSALHVGSSH